MPDHFFDPHEEIVITHQNLPHWQQGEAWVFITWRQADSVPAAKVGEWEAERAAWLVHHPEPWDDTTADEYQTRFLGPFDTWLDQGAGSCLLRDPDNRRIVTNALRYFEGERYRLGPYVVMPNHIHLLISPLRDHSLATIVQSLKRHTSREINKREHRTGTSLWQPDYFNRLIRSQQHLNWVTNYIAKNPRHLPPGTFTLAV